MLQPLRLSFHKFEKNVYLNGYYTFYPLFVGDWPKMKCQHNLLPHRLVRSNKFHLARVFHSWTLFLGKTESIRGGYSRVVLKYNVTGMCSARTVFWEVCHFVNESSY